MTTSDIQPETKSGLRRLIREKMRTSSLEDRAEWSATVLGHLRERPEWLRPGGVVTLFGGMSSEPNLLPLLPWLQQMGMQTAFFAIEGDIMTPYLIQDEQDLVPGVLGVLEPWRDAKMRLKLEDVAVALVPGVAFSSTDGTRLGRGKGHYDRALERMQDVCVRIGVCFHAQILPTVPAEGHDRRVQSIVTEKGWTELPL
ncbi:MAG: 5-formyltetrahydrofolate cyclo-ligase [Roseimicrobium sp.]